jgi:hypothetical protein
VAEVLVLRRRRLAVYASGATAVLAILVAWVAIGRLTGPPSYDAYKPPGLADGLQELLLSLAFPAAYGLGAWVVPRWFGRVYLASAAVVGFLTTPAVLYFDHGLSHIDCGDDCAPAIPTTSFYVAVWLVSLGPAVVAPLLVGFLRWPRHKPTQRGPLAGEDGAGSSDARP